MIRRNTFSVMLAVAISGSFLAGVFEPELRAQGGLPEHIFSLRATGSGPQLDPISTYNKVLQLVTERYYGELPGKSENLKPEVKLTYAAIRGMLNTLDDPYTRFLEPVEFNSLKEDNEGEFEGIGAQLDNDKTKEGYIRVSKPIRNGPAAKAGLMKGDLITRINGAAVKDLSVDEAVGKIRGPANTQVRLTILRPSEGKTRDIVITRNSVEFQVVDYELRDGNIGYIYLHTFNELSDPKIQQAIRAMEKEGMRGLVLDLRGNPGGLLESAIDISSRFIPPNKTAVIIVENERNEKRKTSEARFLGGKWPLVVLVNRTSASASEIVAGAIKDNKAGLVVGTTTFGKGLVQTVVPLEGDAACMITTAKYLTPSGKDINRSREQRGGVEPDYFVDITEEQYVKNNDPQLRQAVEILKAQIAGRPVPAPTTQASARN